MMKLSSNPGFLCYFLQLWVLEWDAFVHLNMKFVHDNCSGSMKIDCWFSGIQSCRWLFSNSWFLVRWWEWNKLHSYHDIHFSNINIFKEKAVMNCEFSPNIDQKMLTDNLNPSKVITGPQMQADLNSIAKVTPGSKFKIMEIFTPPSTSRHSTF